MFILIMFIKIILPYGCLNKSVVLVKVNYMGKLSCDHELDGLRGYGLNKA